MTVTDDLIARSDQKVSRLAKGKPGAVNDTALDQSNNLLTLGPTLVDLLVHVFQLNALVVDSLEDIVEFGLGNVEHSWVALWRIPPDVDADEAPEPN